MEIKGVNLKNKRKLEVKDIIANPPSFIKQRYLPLIVEAGRPIEVNELFEEIMGLVVAMEKVKRDDRLNAQRYYGRRIRALQDMAGLIGKTRTYLHHMYKIATGAIEHKLDPAHEAEFRECSHDWEMLSWALHELPAGSMSGYDFNPDYAFAKTMGGKPVDLFVSRMTGEAFTIGGYNAQLTVVRSNSNTRAQACL
ncbi:hypothetical protein [Vibrio phage vB_pir03]|nr:hypothetical protein [Vibrio phage vB_pir03]